MTGLISSILAILAILLEAWMKAAPARKERRDDNEAQRGRKDLVDGNSSSVEQRIDRVLSDELQNSSPSGKQSDEDILRRLNAL